MTISALNVLNLQRINFVIDEEGEQDQVSFVLDHAFGRVNREPVDWLRWEEGVHVHVAGFSKTFYNV